MADDNDFGFSLVDETELRAAEAEYKSLLTETKSEAEMALKSAEFYQNKVDGIMAMIMPLLTNLTKDPEKTYIFWPGRTEKINAFIQKLKDYAS